MDLETRRRINKSENFRILRELGVLSENYNPSLEKPPAKKRRVVKAKSDKETLIPIRRSRRVQSLEPVSYKDMALNNIDEEDKSQNKEQNSSFRQKEKVVNQFGQIEGIPVGTHFASRDEACAAQVHRATVAGIHSSKLGCYSIALSGGYEDDIDNGDSFLFTGSGGRDLKGTKAKPKNLRTAAQTKDQELVGHNLHLMTNIKENIPVRVIRGYKLNSEFAPSEGYRYDGLYKVVDCFPATGKSGFRVYKYRFERLKNQEPAPWS